MEQVTVYFTKALNENNDVYYHRKVFLDQSENNTILVNENIEECYDQIFGEAVNNYNRHLNVDSELITNYYQHIKHSKRLNTHISFKIQIGNIDFYRRFSDENWHRINHIFIDYYNDFIERNLQLYVYSAVIYNDEAIPYLQIDAIPIAHDYKQGLQKRPSFSKVLKNLGYITDDINWRTGFKIWREHELRELDKFLVSKGLERKNVGSESYGSVDEYRSAHKTIEDQVNELTASLAEAKQEVEQWKSEAKEEHERVLELDADVQKLSIENENLKNKLDNFKENLAKLTV